MPWLKIKETNPKPKKQTKKNQTPQPPKNPQKYFFTKWYWHKSSSKLEWVIFFSKCITFTWRLRYTCLNHLIPLRFYFLYFHDLKGAFSAIYNNNCCVILETSSNRIYHTQEEKNDTGKISLTYNKETNSWNHFPIPCH